MLLVTLCRLKSASIIKATDTVIMRKSTVKFFQTADQTFSFVNSKKTAGYKLQSDKFKCKCSMI